MGGAGPEGGPQTQGKPGRLEETHQVGGYLRKQVIEKTQQHGGKLGATGQLGATKETQSQDILGQNSTGPTRLWPAGVQTRAGARDPAPAASAGCCL